MTFPCTRAHMHTHGYMHDCVLSGSVGQTEGRQELSWGKGEETDMRKWEEMSVKVHSTPKAIVFMKPQMLCN